MPIEFGNTELTELTPKISVLGVGGAGCNAVNNMIAADLQGVDFIVANTDAQALAKSGADNRIQLGVQITQGLGAGSRPQIGEAAAEETMDDIENMLSGSHMAFVTAGMGGGTGTGAAPVIARMAREKGILTVGVVTKPFQFEGGRRMKIAEAGITELAKHVDTLIIIPNQNLFRVANERTTFADAFNMADEVLHSGVRSITDLMVMPGLINLDFADVRTVMSEMGKAMMGTGEADGETRALDAAAAAISNPLLEDVSLRGAKGVIINVTGGMDMTLYEVDEAVNMVREQADPDALIVFGSAFSTELDGKLRVSVVATGIEGGKNVDAIIPTPRRETIETPTVSKEIYKNTDASNAGTVTDAETVINPNTIKGDGHDESALSKAEKDNFFSGTALAADLSAELSEPASNSVPSASESDTQQPDLSTVKLGDTDVGVGQQVFEETSEVPKPSGASDEESSNGYELEQHAVKAIGDNAFVADAPMEPKARVTDFKTATVFEETAYEKGGSKDAQDHTTASSNSAPKKKSLFQIMTSSLRTSELEDAKPAAPSNDAGLTTNVNPNATRIAEPETVAPALGGVAAEDRPVTASSRDTKDQLEIPSFLKRTQN